MPKLNKRFKKNPRYPHQRSEGLTRRGATRQDRLMTGNKASHRRAPITGKRMDREFRHILLNVTHENILEKTLELTRFGLSVDIAFSILRQELQARGLQ